MGISFAKRTKRTHFLAYSAQQGQMLGNGIYVSTPCKSWSYSGLLELIKQVLKKFTLKNMTYGRT
jgi:hypothetical protein